MKSGLDGLWTAIVVGSLAGVSLGVWAQDAGGDDAKVTVDWTRTVATLKTVPTMLICPEPALRQGSPVHDKLFAAVKALGAQYVRYQPYESYPGLSVAELAPPTKTTTSWDFSAIDSIVIPFLEATDGHEPILNFAPIPSWMFKTDKPVKYSPDPNELRADYPSALELIDPSGKQAADYFARMASWYTKGGFTDENGKYHHSGFHYDLHWWGILNEVDTLSPEIHTRLHDAIAVAILKIKPDMKFVGGAVGQPSYNPQFFEYFLNPTNHRPNAALDMISYHFYAGYFAGSSKYEGLNEWQYTFFNQANGFLNTVRYIESIRKRLSPATRVNVEELGSIVEREDFVDVAASAKQPAALPAGYWNLSGALYAYLYLELAKIGIDVAGESQLLTDAPFMPSMELMDRKTAEPNARWRVLQLIKTNFNPGDKLAATQIGSWSSFDAPFGEAADMALQAFLTPQGRKVLVINKRARELDIPIGPLGHVTGMDVIDVQSGGGAPRHERVDDGRLRLNAFAVAVLGVE